MPKIIENVREQLLAETKRQIAENGYEKTTVRSVAGACDIGVGTVYNKFSQKLFIGMPTYGHQYVCQLIAQHFVAFGQYGSKYLFCILVTE